VRGTLVAENIWGDGEFCMNGGRHTKIRVYSIRNCESIERQ